MTSLIFISLIFTAILVLNIMASKTISSSKTLTQKEKQQSLVTIWLIPLLGVLISTKRLTNKIRNNKEKNEQKMVTALNKFTKNIKSINEEIKQQHKDAEKKNGHIK